MKTVQIHEIELDTELLGMDSINYPNNGLYLLKVKGQTHLAFVNKKIKDVMWIAPKDVWSDVLNVQTELVSTIEDLPQQNQYDGDFILEFARILLNRKHV